MIIAFELTIGLEVMGLVTLAAMVCASSAAVLWASILGCSNLAPFLAFDSVAADRYPASLLIRFFLSVWT